MRLLKVLNLYVIIQKLYEIYVMLSDNDNTIKRFENKITLIIPKTKLALKNFRLVLF